MAYHLKLKDLFDHKIEQMNEALSKKSQEVAKLQKQLGDQERFLELLLDSKKDVEKDLENHKKDLTRYREDWKDAVKKLVVKEEKIIKLYDKKKRLRNYKKEYGILREFSE